MFWVLHPHVISAESRHVCSHGLIGVALSQKCASRLRPEAYFFKIDALTTGGDTSFKVRQALRNTGCQKTVLGTLGEKPIFEIFVLWPLSQHHFCFWVSHESSATGPNIGCGSHGSKKTSFSRKMEKLVV